MAARKKLVKLRLYHFQSHVDTTLHFDPVSTAIVGPTDVGKSAITRALYWVLYNKPARIGHPGTPDEFTTWGENHCFVTTVFDDGTEITRGRKNKENYYILVNPDGTRLPMRGFGFDVPQAVMDAHGMYPLALDDKEISLNITQQHDSIFMLEDGAPMRAKAVGKLSGADKADGAIGVVSTWHRSASNDKRDALDKIKDLNETIEHYSFVDDLDEAIAILSEILRRISVREKLCVALTREYQALLQLDFQKKGILGLMAYESSLVTLDQLINLLTALQARLGVLNAALSTFLNVTRERGLLNFILLEANKLRALDIHIDAGQEAVDRYYNLTEVLRGHSALESELSALTRLLTEADNIEMLDKLILRLGSATNLYRTILTSYTDLATLTGRIAQGKLYITKKEAELQGIVVDYKDVLQSASVCPFCYSEITEEQLSKIHM